MIIEKDTVKAEIAKNFEMYRKKDNITQKELAFLLGVKDNTISQWEKGINSIDVEMLFKACDIFGISINDIYGKYALEKKTILTKKENKLIGAYRNQPHLQEAVDKVLGIHETQEEVKVFRAARSEDNASPEFKEMPKARMDKFRNTKPAEEI